VVTGIFSIFDDLDFEALPEGMEPPKGPTLPYTMTILERHPCPTSDKCKSKIFDDEFLPGYDEATNSITTTVKIVETETWTMTITYLPNHPTQQLLTFSDHTALTTQLIQFTKEDFPTRCATENYTAPHPVFNSDDWYITYVGDVEREEVTYEVLEELYTVPSSTNRFFHLITKNMSGEGSGEEAIFHFEDDSSTGQLKRTFVPSAVLEGWTIQEVIVLDFEEINETRAKWHLIDYADLFECDGKQPNGFLETDFPVIGSDPFAESLATVAYYAQDFIEMNSRGTGWYWQTAVTNKNMLFEAFAEEEAKIQEELKKNTVNASNASESERRLLLNTNDKSTSICVPLVKADSSWQTGDLCYTFSWPDDPTVCKDCYCHTIKAKEDLAKVETGWWSSGAASVGDYCVTSGQWGATDGEFVIGLRASIEKSKNGADFDCEIGIDGSAKARTGEYGWSCGWWESHEDCDDDKKNEREAWEQSCIDRNIPIQDNLRRLQEDEDDASNSSEAEEDEEEVEEAAARRLLDFTRRRAVDIGAHRRRRRRRVGDTRRRMGVEEVPDRRRRTPTCIRETWNNQWDDSRRRFKYATGGDFSMSIQGTGGCSVKWKGVSANVGVSGKLTMNFGPWPKKPHQPKAEGTINLGSCYSLIGASVCVDLFKETIYSESI